MAEEGQKKIKREFSQIKSGNQIIKAIYSYIQKKVLKLFMIQGKKLLIYLIITQKLNLNLFIDQNMVKLREKDLKY